MYCTIHIASKVERQLYIWLSFFEPQGTQLTPLTLGLTLDPVLYLSIFSTSCETLVLCKRELVRFDAKGEKN